MIIGPDFVWLHFPKCGGTSLEHALRGLLAGRECQFDEINPGSGVIWHHSVKQRMEADPTFNPTGKRIISCIRRLPAWILSRVHYEAHRSGRIATRDMIARGQFFEADGGINNADTYVRLYSPVDVWLRTEHLAEDVAAAFGFDEVETQDAIGQVNVTPNYVKDPDFWFTQADLRRLYDANPLWADVEARVSGGGLARQPGRWHERALRRTLPRAVYDHIFAREPALPLHHYAGREQSR